MSSTLPPKENVFKRSFSRHPVSRFASPFGRRDSSIAPRHADIRKPVGLVSLKHTFRAPKNMSELHCEFIILMDGFRRFFLGALMMMAVDFRDHFSEGEPFFLNWVCSGCGYLKRKETELDDGWEGQIRKIMLSYISKGSNNVFQGFLREALGLKGNHVFVVFVQLMGKNGDVQHQILGLG